MDNEWIVWVMDWHWGWQVFWGLTVLGLIAQIVEWVTNWVRLPVDDKVLWLKICGRYCEAWILEFLTWIIGLVTRCILLATILVFVYFVCEYVLSQSS